MKNKEEIQINREIKKLSDTEKRFYSNLMKDLEPISWNMDKVHKLERIQLALEKNRIPSNEDRLKLVKILKEKFVIQEQKDVEESMRTSPIAQFKMDYPNYYKKVEKEYNQTFKKWLSISKRKKDIKEITKDLYPDIVQLIYHRITDDENIKSEVLRFEKSKRAKDDYTENLLRYIVEEPIYTVLRIPNLILSDYSETWKRDWAEYQKDIEHGRKFRGRQITDYNLDLYGEVFKQNDKDIKAGKKANFKQAIRLVLKRRESYIQDADINTYYKSFMVFRKRNKLKTYQDFQAFRKGYKK